MRTDERDTRAHHDDDPTAIEALEPEDREPEELGADLLALLRAEPTPGAPPGLTARILRRVRDQLTLRDAVDLVTAAFSRVLLGGHLPESPTIHEPGDDRDA